MVAEMVEKHGHQPNVAYITWTIPVLLATSSFETPDVCVRYLD